LCSTLGDPSRPFPTEPEFRASALAAPRTNPPVVPPAFSLLRQQHAASSGMGRVSSPMAGMPQMPVQGKVWSPRTGYQQASPSPRGRGGVQWSGRGGGPGGVSPFQKRPSQIGENSPRMVSPTVNINFVSPPPRMNPPPINKVEQMSSDSSSSSSSEDESPK
uniref:BAT2_N domain-containing protein n=1 Tax=Nippostrongylus brasiliensis TaxID=27835 RepID=A0A0N4YWV3_NIPBR